MGKLLNVKDVISASLAECYVVIEGSRYHLIQAKNLSAKFERTKTEIGILGKSGKGNKATGWKGTGTMGLHYNTSLFRKLVREYKDTGKDFYFDMTVTNEDPTSTIGRQTIILKDCNIDSLDLVKFDTDAETLDEEMSFTYEDFEMPEEFRSIEGE